MSKAHTERPGNMPKLTRHTSPQTHPSLTPAACVPWEVRLFSLMAAALLSRNARLHYYEAEDRRKAQEIDRLRAQSTVPRRAA